MDETLEQRLAAVERALTDGDHDLSELATSGEVAHRVDGIESDVDSLADRVAELEAATQALRGYVGNVRAVNQEVERRADAALAAVESHRATGNDAEQDEQFPVAGRPDDGDELHQSTDSDDDCRCPHCGTVQTAGERPAKADTQPAVDRLFDGGQSRAGSVTTSARETLGAATDSGESGSNGGDADAGGLFSRVRERL